jgi:hypothetical protein
MGRSGPVSLPQRVYGVPKQHVALKPGVAHVTPADRDTPHVEFGLGILITASTCFMSPASRSARFRFSNIWPPK